MIHRFKKDLYKKLCQLLEVPFVRGHNKSISMESAGESVSSAGSVDVVATKGDVI